MHTVPFRSDPSSDSMIADTLAAIAERVARINARLAALEARANGKGDER